MSKDWGFIRGDKYGNWKWPFREMAVGDVFRVSATDRAPHKVRNMVSSRSSQMNCRFSCATGPDGTVLVTRGSIYQADCGYPVEMKYSYFVAFLYSITHAAVRADDLPWLEVHDTQRPVFVPLDASQYVGNKRIMVYVNPQLCGIEIRLDGLNITPLPDDMLPEEWAMQLLLED